ncbi:hypothetical protein MASR1M60_00620 [Rhodocyclaceae bacterium]
MSLQETPPRPEEAAILISVIVPAYNYGHLLTRMLDSVVVQLDGQTELIVVDDGSTDATPAVLAGYRARVPQLQIVHQINAGAGAARNHGVRLARGSYVLPLDADDELLPGALATLIDAITANPGVGIFIGGHVSVFADGRERLHLPGSISSSPVVRVKDYLIDKRISISHGSTLFRRDLLLACPYAEHLPYSEDIPVFAYVLAHSEAITLSRPLARIHKHSDSLRHRRNPDGQLVHQLTQAVFNRLPAECQFMRRTYEAQRMLSQFRAAAVEHPKTAQAIYRQAFRLSPLQAMRWPNLVRFVRLLYQGKKA